MVMLEVGMVVTAAPAVVEELQGRELQSVHDCSYSCFCTVCSARQQAVSKQQPAAHLASSQACSVDVKALKRNQHSIHSRCCQTDRPWSVYICPQGSPKRERPKMKPVKPYNHSNDAALHVAVPNARRAGSTGVVLTYTLHQHRPQAPVWLSKRTIRKRRSARE